MIGARVEARIRLALDERLTVLSVENGIEQLIGFGAEDLQSSSVKLQDLIHADDADIAGMLFSPNSEIKSGSFNIRLRHADGRIRCVRGEYRKTPARVGGEAVLDLLLQDAKNLHESRVEPAGLTTVDAMMALADEALYFKNRDHVFTAANRQAFSAFAGPGAVDTGLLGKTDYDLFPEKYADVSYRLEKKVLAGNREGGESQALPAEDGRERWIEGRKHAVRDPEGKVIGLFGVAIDITQHMKARQALASVELEYRNIFDNALEGIFRTSIDGRVLMVNPAFARMLGYDSPQDVLDSVKGVGHDFWVDKSEQAVYLQKIRESDAHAVLGFECEFKRKGGTPLRISLNSRLIYGDDGEPRCYDGFFIDIAERKRTESALRESEAALKESQHIAGLGSYEGDLASGNWTSSEILDRMFGIDKEYERTLEGWAARVHPDDRAMMTTYMREETLGQKKPFDKEYRIVRHSDGAVRWIHDLGRLEFDGCGHPIKMHGTVRDITERKLAEQALRESEESLKESQRIAGLGTYVTNIREGSWTSSEVLDQLFGIGEEYDRSIEGWGELVHPDDREGMVAYFLNEVVGQRKPFERVYRIVRQSDGAVRWVHGLGRLDYDGAGQPVRMHGTIKDITEWREAEDALRESEESLKAAQRIAGIGSFVTDVRTGISKRSDVLLELLGVGRDYDPSFAGWVALTHPDDRASLASHLASVTARGGDSFTREFRIIRPSDGAVRWMQSQGRVEFDKAGQAKTFRGTVQDITERKLAEAALRESKELLQLFIDNTPVPIAMFDREMRYLALSQPWARDHSNDSREIIGRSHYEVNPEVPERWKETHRRGLAGERQKSEEDRYDRADGTMQWIRWEILPWQTADGAIGGIIMFYEDITERKLAEAALRESKELLLLFIAHAPAALAMFDSQMRYLVASRRWLEEYSLDEREIVGHSHYEIVPDLPERWKEAHRRGLAGETLRGDEDRFERANGTVQWIRWAVVPWRAADGSVGGIILFAEDITRQKETEERLRLAASVFTNALEGIMITDPSGAILDVNEMFTSITGYSRTEALGKNPNILRSGLQSEEFYVKMWRTLSENGQWSGEIWNRTKGGEIIAETLTINAVRDAAGKVLRFVALFSDVTALKEHEREIEHVTYYDVLTSLPNRALLADRLRQAMTLPSLEGKLLAVAYLDLDGFKGINDNHGHISGDRLLTSLAFNMKCALRKGDTLARLGGDEFVAVLLGLDSAEASVPVLNRLLEAAAEPVQVGDLALGLTASIGVAFYPQKEEVDADLLLRQADQAMYQAKLDGGNRYHIFDPDHDLVIRGRHENLEHIRRALAAHEFVLYYQPKVNMRTGKVVGAEALIRWQHPERGLLPPGMFLPVIEEHPLAIEVGEWVIDTALTQVETWRDAGLDIPVSVNVGALQLQQADFVDRLSALLAAHPRVSPLNLELEVLETSALQDVTQTSQVLSACQGIGVSFAIDDFGTGYSSLTYLKRLPASILKIDQSFVSDMLEDPENLNILEGILGLGSAFHRQVIAEGVETVEHGLMLLRLGCELAQGYGIARPMPGSDLPGWVAAWRPDLRWAEVPPVHSGNRTLLYASVEHRAWIAAFDAFLQGKRHAPPALDQRQCRFGAWLDTEAQAGRGQHAAYRSVDSTHRQFHALAAEIVAAQTQRRSSEGIGRLGELHSLGDSLLEQLETLMQWS